LAVAHLVSKLHTDPDSQSIEAMRIADEIRYAEHEQHLTRTILVGDLNMNPFENGVVAARGLHGIMSQQIAKKGSRTVQDTDYPYFYNPMWNFLGDLSQNPPGTYYFSGGQHIEFFWNMFDQVMIRPELLTHFKAHSTRIIHVVGKTSLLN